MLLASGAGAASISQGGFTQTFDVQLLPGLKAPTAKSDGPYQFSLNWSTTTAGATVAPPVTDVEIKLPAGVELRKQFLSGGTTCSKATLLAGKLSQCKGAKVGEGSVQLDFLPFTTDTVPASVAVYLGPGGEGAVGSLLIMATPDPSNAFVAANPVVANTRPVISAPIYRDSSSGYGLRMEMPIEIDAPVVVSIRSFTIKMTGTPGQLKSSKGKKYFWISQPTCNRPSAKFLATFKYIGAPDASIATNLPSRFKCAKPAKPTKKKKRKK